MAPRIDPTIGLIEIDQPGDYLMFQDQNRRSVSSSAYNIRKGQA
jgi:hypothetical protein